MPIIKSAKKRVRQGKKRRDRNFPVRTKMKTYMKKVLEAVKDGKKKEAEEALNKAYKIIDTAAKKNIIHKNNAARKKSMLARRVKNIDEENSKPQPVEKKKSASKKKTIKSKAPAKKLQK